MRARKRESGLTLIEILVAISLLSLLSVGILMALRVGSTAWEKTNSNLMLDRRIATANAILHAELESILPVWAQFEDPVARVQYMFVFFQGEPESMRFVTAYSLEGGIRGGLRLVELQVAPGERGKRVLLNEQVYEGPLAGGRVVETLRLDPLAGGLRPVFRAIAALPSSFVIADELESCAFSYQNDEMGREPRRWAPVWTEQFRLPAAISIQLNRRRDSARLRPVTVTAPVRARMLSP